MDGESQRMALAAFFVGGERLAFDAAQPQVSVILVTHNQGALTIRCLKSLQAVTVPIEVVIVDNASTDATPRLFERLDGATVIRHSKNEGFLRAANAGARRARADAVLFLNNDTIVEGGSIEAALETLQSSDTIGAVVGRLVLLDGRLQEAGSIVWRDGTCQGYGRGDNPWAPQYMFRRNVDYGSGAFLLTYRSIFLELGGFDERYAPAYFEDADYCVRLWQRGARVVYEPRALIRHAEHGSSSAQEALAAQAERRDRFAETQRSWLQEYARPRSASLLRARTRWTGGQRVLMIDDRVPHPQMGSGYPRALAILRTLLDLGHEITQYPLLFPRESWDDAYADIPRDVEILLGGGAAGLPPHLERHAGDYDTIIVSRPHNMRVFRPAMTAVVERPAIIYDAEAIFAIRDLQRAALQARLPDLERARAMVVQEVALARECDAVLTVSPREQQQFVDHGYRNVVVLGHAFEPAPTPRSFAERAGLLFVGPCVYRDTPNSDAVRWFVSEIWPLVRQRLGGAAALTLAGKQAAEAIQGLDASGITALGVVDDLGPLFDQARVFIAPLRFAAGIPIKVQTAAGAGVPAVTTTIIADQLGWRHGVELLVADEAAAFADHCVKLHQDEGQWQGLRAAALQRVTVECAPARFRSNLERALVLAQASRFGEAVTTSVEPNHESGSK
jgi:GT2 family glycosyltransferase/glycosyltransferase involved in cell wall biosynthesis